MVVDADALNLLAREPERLPAGWIITPHPGEAARLLGVETAAVQADRLGAVRELHARYGAVSVLKGAGTLVASGAADAIELHICDRGNPGMATAGMGDVLTGVIAGLRAQSRGQRAGRARRRAGACARRRFGRAGRAARPDRQRRGRRSCAAGSIRERHQHDAWITRSGEETEALGARLLGTPPAPRLAMPRDRAARRARHRQVDFRARRAARARRARAHQESELHPARDLRAAGSRTRCTWISIGSTIRTNSSTWDSPTITGRATSGSSNGRRGRRAAARRPTCASSFRSATDGHRIERIETSTAK